MIKSLRSGDNTVLTRFSVKTKNGSLLKFRIMVLPKHRHEEFIELFMKYFVPQETTHVVTGILDNTEALNEYRKFISKYFKNEFVKKIICCLDSDETASEIFGGFALKLHTKGDRHDGFVEAQTEPVKQCKRIEKLLERVVPSTYLMKKYNVDRYYELICAVVRSDMREMGILKEMSKASHLMCQMHGLPLLAAWCTSVGSQKVADKNGSELAYEISYKVLGQLSGVTFESCPPTVKLMVQRNFKKSKI